MAGRNTAVAIAVAAVVAIAGAARSGAQSEAACGLPDTKPLWVEYGEGSVTPDVRALFQRPGVVVAASGTGAIPAAYRNAGAATTYFRNLSPLVGDPADPADAASIPGAADALLAVARASTACATPTIALNELSGPGAATPWSPTTAQYRANVLALMQRLQAAGARPVLFVQGNPNVAGDAGAWWQQVARAGVIAYEAYYDARRITSMGAVAGNRRLRLGMRGALDLWTNLGIGNDRLGLVLGFHTAPIPGSGGRQGLQPREEWLRFVKWNALAAMQVAKDRGLDSIWSWGWGTFGPDSVDPDKPAAACVYLWTRDRTLCDGVAAGGPSFQASLTEGQIILRPGMQCEFAGGPIRTADVAAWTTFAGGRQAALDLLFTRALLAGVKVDERAVLAAEQRAIRTRFKGRRTAYVTALKRLGLTPEQARAVVRDDLRRRAFAAQQPTPLEALADRATAVLAGATCLQDQLPGTGAFPSSDARDVAVPPVGVRLPFLLPDRTPPAAPAPVQTTNPNAGVTLAWAAGTEPDLAGYAVYRGTTLLTPALLARPTFTDPKPTGEPYVVRAVDTNGNVSP
jgi:hypothetical protein